MDSTEQFIVLDETYLPQMAELYKNALYKRNIMFF